MEDAELGFVGGGAKNILRLTVQKKKKSKDT